MIPIAPAHNNFSPTQSVDIQKEKRRRSKRSCDFCRQKKTRCDGGLKHPCTKCRLANVECVYLTKQKKRGPTKGSYVEMLEKRLKRMETLVQKISTNNKDKPEEIEEEEEDEVGSLGSQDSVPQAACPANFHVSNELDKVGQQMNGLTIKDYQRTRYMGSSSGMHMVNIDILRNNRKLRFMDAPSWFIQKLNDEEDEHVIMKTKEINPPQEIQMSAPTPERLKPFEDIPLLDTDSIDCLIHTYFTRFHIDCPIINKIEFLEQYYYHNPSPPDKFLMYAIVFMASIVSDESSFNGRLTSEQLMSLREQLKIKAYQIIGVIHKRPFISTVQVLLLLSMYAEDEVSNDDEDMSHWLFSGIAIRLAQDMGLHLDCSNWKIPPQEIELRRRLWYTCYIIDRWISAQLGRPLSILDKEFDVKLPSVYELDTSIVRTVSLERPPLLLEAEKALKEYTPLYYSFSRFVGVTEVLGQVLVTLYSAKNKQNRNKESITTLENSLNNWRQTFANEILPNSADASLLQISYFTVLIFIYRPFIKEKEDTELSYKALGICTNAANQILAVEESAEHRTLVNAPWSPSAYCVFQAAIIFLHNARGENEVISRQGKENLDRCVKIYINTPRLCRTRTVRVLMAVASSYRVSLTEICSPLLQESPDKSLDYDRNHSLNPKEFIDSVTVTRGHLPQSQSNFAYDNYDIPFNSTRPEDMFNIALSSGGFDKPTGKKIKYFQEQQEKWGQQQQMNPGFDLNNVDPSTFSNLFTNDGLMPGFDLSSLRSDVPLWDVPSAVTWNEWEGFMKTTM